MEYIEPSGNTATVLCCDCGTPIEPNPTNQCIGCIRSHYDISQGITKQCTLQFCRGCERYLEPPSTWVQASLESKELLKVCLKKIKGLNHIRLVDAGFVWTEPHSKRIKVKLVAQKEVDSGAIMQQEFVVEFLVASQMCSDCHRVEAKDYWRALVQVRQKTGHKRTFYYLEQMLLKYNAHENALGIKQNAGGLDFFFANEQTARKLLDFLASVVPCRWTHSKKLISHDVHSNIYNYKYTYSVEIVPVCKDSVISLPSKLAHHFGGIGQICVVQRVTNNIFIIDPNTGQFAEATSSMYWKMPFSEICTTKRLTEYVVIDICEADVKHFKGQGQLSNKHQVADVWVQKSGELGSGETVFCRSHLGHILQPGDSVLGFDMMNANVNDSSLDKMDDDKVPDVVLVKKLYGDKSARNRQRRWKLRHLGLDDELGSQNNDYMGFLDDLEEDPLYRKSVNIYKDHEKINGCVQVEANSEFPTISLEEMLDDLTIHDDPMGD